MKALVVFESIFGNTQHIAEAIGEGLRSAGEVEVVEVGHARPELGDIDLLVVGGPTHAWGMSRPMTRTGARDQADKSGKHAVSEGIGVRDWLGKLAPPQGKVASAAFDTALEKKGWFPTGSAAKGETTYLRDKGYRVIAEPQQFFVKAVDGPLVDGEFERAKAWGAELAKGIR